MRSELLAPPNWYLEGYVGDSKNLRYIALNSWPFRIGRRSDNSFCLNSTGVSKHHAEIWQSRESLWLRDLNSRNGTFVNGVRIAGDARLKSGDVLHFANMEFRLLSQTPSQVAATQQLDKNEWVHSLGQFERLFDAGGVLPYFQPIVDLRTGQVCGHEVLARSQVDGLQNPVQMFSVAARLNMEAQLSRLFRHEGVRQGQELPGLPNLFLNTHPAELDDEAMLASLTELRRGFPEQPLTLEIHEAAVTDPKVMRNLHRALGELNIQLAYDDFGAGQARLVDLIEVPPHVLKFDICLVRDIHLASEQRRGMLQTLVRMAHDLGVAVLAEGIENGEEGEVCAELGFEYAQGFHYGRPAPASQFVRCVDR